MQKKPNMQLIQGLVSAFRWDDKGHVIEFQICSPDETDYRVIPEGPGLLLGPFLRQWVQAHGEVTQDGIGPVIRIHEIIPGKNRRSGVLQ